MLLLACVPTPQPAPEVAEQPAEATQPTIPPDLLGVASLDFSTLPADDQLSRYAFAWDRIEKSWTGDSGTDIREACMTVYKAKSFYPEMTMLYVLDSFASQIPQSPTGDDLPSRFQIAQVADDLYIALEDSYYGPIEAAQAAQAEADAVLQETIAANQAAARERGAQHNAGQLERQRQANAQQAELQQRAIAAGEEARQRQIESGIIRGPGVTPSTRRRTTQPYTSTSTSVQRYRTQGSTTPQPAPPEQYTPQSSQRAVQTSVAPSTATGTVWIAPHSGKGYHKGANCSGLRNARSTMSMTLSNAEAQGYTPCKICY